MPASARRLQISALLATLGLLLAIPAFALGAQTTLVATLKGSNEVPAGDPNGSGSASITLDAASGQVCWTINVANIAPATASHIHQGGAGTAGQVLIGLDTNGFTGSTTGCVTADTAKVASVLANPGGFYVNVHTADYPGGAVRGQLGAAMSNTAMSRPAGVSVLTELGLVLVVVALLAAVLPRRIFSIGR